MKVILLQARTNSKRLPNKALKTILGKPMIIHQLLRISKSKLSNKIILITSNQKSDDNLANVVLSYGFNVYRGELDNVLKRFYDCSIKLDLNDDDTIIRLTGDCPLSDSDIVDECINQFTNCDYISNCDKRIYPDGFDVEVFSFKTLKFAFNNAISNYDKEHTTTYMKSSNKIVKKQIHKLPIYPNLQLSVDTKKDFELVNKIFNHFNQTQFPLSEIIDFLKKDIKI